jgi:PBP1b-binding outer membrane lipoprotein LpoB
MIKMKLSFIALVLLAFALNGCKKSKSRVEPVDTEPPVTLPPTNTSSCFSNPITNNAS